MTKESRTYFDEGLSAEVPGEILYGIAVCPASSAGFSLLERNSRSTFYQ
ncbi:hypothetical protein ACU4GI_09185 [Cupriavidus basilensis]|nr:hypothetical protein [Cupriavidus sp. SK-3]